MKEGMPSHGIPGPSTPPFNTGCKNIQQRTHTEANVLYKMFLERWLLVFDVRQRVLVNRSYDRAIFDLSDQVSL